MLALEWREWMTKRVTNDYLANRAFYQVQAGALVDNPDQRIASDVRCDPVLPRLTWQMVMALWRSCSPPCSPLLLGGNQSQ